jgi:uncharacterized membrane protein
MTDPQTSPKESETLPVMETPYVPPPPVGPKARMTRLHVYHPFTWLARGWEDMRQEPFIAAVYGTCFWFMAIVLSLVFRHNPEYTLSIVSGCLLVGPFLAMGLYEVSRMREQGLKPDLGVSLTCWDSHLRSMAMLVLVLMVIELLWGRASLVVFAVFFNTGMPSTTGVIEAIFNPENLEFVLVYTAVGGAFASLVFSTAVVSIPMILDRDTDAISAAITSLRVVFSNPLTMVTWGGLISLMVVLSLSPWSPWSLAIVVVGPLLGHASWHAYRASVQWEEAEPQSAQS